MQKIYKALVIVFITSSFFACKKPDCVPPVIKYITFYNNAGPVTAIPDTSASIGKYNTGTHFSQLAESFSKVLLDKNKQLAFPYKGAETYDYDWQITLQPSGRTYFIRNITHDDKNTQGNNCTSTINCFVNDSVYSIPGNPYSATPYFTSDIKIKYDF